MKKVLLGLLVCSSVATVAITSASAFKGGNSTTTNTIQNQSSYVDLNNDGICDNSVSCANGQFFVDSNNDGICDNYNFKTCGNRSGRGRGCGRIRM